MKRGVLTFISVGLTASAALATNINISVQQSNGTNAITVDAGATVNYKIVGTLTDDLNEGLALIGLSLDFTGGDLLQANSPAGDISCANPMPAFVVPEGIGNPAGFGGTVIGGDLIQIGGAQNTINNTVNNATFPIGAVITGVAQPSVCGPAVIATGSLTAPNAPGQYFLNAYDVIANVIGEGEDGTGFWAVEPAGVGTVTNLTVNVPSCVAAVGETWESVVSHVPNFPGGDVGLVIPEDTTPLDPNDSPFSEPRSGVSKLVVTFTGNTIDAATATPGNIALAGRDSGDNLMDLSGITIGTAVTAGDSKLEITFTPALTDFAKYRVTLNGVQAATCGTPVAVGTQRIFTALRGDANGDRRVTATDLGLVRSLVGTNPIDAAILNHVRSDFNDDGRITATDLGGIRALIGRDARLLTDP